MCVHMHTYIYTAVSEVHGEGGEGEGAMNGESCIETCTWPFVKQMKVKVIQSCPSLCNPVDYKSVEFSRPEY